MILCCNASLYDLRMALSCWPARTSIFRTRLGTKMAARMAITARTPINSISVKARDGGFIESLDGLLTAPRDRESFSRRAAFHRRPDLVLEEWVAVERNPPGCRSAGFQTCCIADFQVGRMLEVAQPAGLKTHDTADLEVCAMPAIPSSARLMMMLMFMGSLEKAGIVVGIFIQGAVDLTQIIQHVV